MSFLLSRNKNFPKRKVLLRHLNYLLKVLYLLTAKAQNLLRSYQWWAFLFVLRGVKTVNKISQPATQNHLLLPSPCQPLSGTENWHKLYKTGHRYRCFLVSSGVTFASSDK